MPKSLSRQHQQFLPPVKNHNLLNYNTKRCKSSSESISDCTNFLEKMGKKTNIFQTLHSSSGSEELPRVKCLELVRSATFSKKFVDLRHEASANVLLKQQLQRFLFEISNGLTTPSHSPSNLRPWLHLHLAAWKSWKLYFVAVSWFGTLEKAWCNCGFWSAYCYSSPAKVCWPLAWWCLRVVCRGM